MTGWPLFFLIMGGMLLLAVGWAAISDLISAIEEEDDL